MSTCKNWNECRRHNKKMEGIKKEQQTWKEIKSKRKKKVKKGMFSSYFLYFKYFSKQKKSKNQIYFIYLFSKQKIVFKNSKQIGLKVH